jgi:myosin heavy subunit
LLEDENKVLICENGTLKDSLIIAESEIKELQVFKDDCRSTHAGLAKVNESLKSKVGEIEENVSKYNAMLEDRIVGYKISIEESEEKNLVLARELAEFKKLCEILEDKVITYDKDQNAETVKISKLNSDLTAKIQNLEQSLYFASETQEKLVSDLKNEKLGLEKSLFETQENCNEIASMQASNKWLEEKLSDLEIELGTIGEVIIVHKSRNQELESRNEQLEGILEEHENGLRISQEKIELQMLDKMELSLKIEKMKKTLATQETTTQNLLSKENKELKVAMKANLCQIEEISRAQKDLISENADLQLNLEVMNGKLSEYINFCKDTETLKLQNIDLTCAIATLETTNKELTTKNLDSNNEISAKTFDFDTTISAKNAQAEKYQTEIINLKSNLQNLTTSLNTEREKSAGLVEEINGKLPKYIKLCEDTETLKLQNTDLKSTIAMLKTTNKELTTKNLDFNNEIPAKTLDIDTTISSNNAQAEKYQTEIINLKSNLQNLTTSLTTEREKSAGLSSINSQLTTDLADQKIFQQVFTKES